MIRVERLAVAMTKDVRISKSVDIVLDVYQLPRRVRFDAPWNWLAAGWRDMWRIPLISLTYGGIFALAVAALALGLWHVGAQSLCLAIVGGLLLLGPLISVGLYEASRRLTCGEEVGLRDVASAGFGARGQLAFFGAVLLFAFLGWTQIAFLLLMLFFGTTGLPPLGEFMQVLLLTPRGLGFLIVGTMTGGLLAALVFAISAMAVPMLLVRQIDAVSAARASLDAVIRNPKPMALWAALIVMIMAAGFVTLLAGLIVAFPLIGHATWHAYADVYREPEATPQPA